MARDSSMQSIHCIPQGRLSEMQLAEDNDLKPLANRSTGMCVANVAASHACMSPDKHLPCIIVTTVVQQPDPVSLALLNHVNVNLLSLCLVTLKLLRTEGIWLMHDTVALTPPQIFLLRPSPYAILSASVCLSMTSHVPHAQHELYQLGRGLHSTHR